MKCLVTKLQVAISKSGLPEFIETLFDKTSSLIKTKSILGSSGITTKDSWTAYNVSHPIPVESGKTYSFQCNTTEYGEAASLYFYCDAEGTLIGERLIATYSSDKTYATFTATQNGYVLVNVLTADLDTFKFIEGSSI